MDKFKFINDTFGHDVGDTVLIKVTESILAVTGNQFPLSRLGGEEFVVVLTDVPQATATVWAEKIRQKIAQIAVRVPFEQFECLLSKMLRITMRSIMPKIRMSFIPPQALA